MAHMSEEQDQSGIRMMLLILFVLLDTFFQGEIRQDAYQPETGPLRFLFVGVSKKDI